MAMTNYCLNCFRETAGSVRTCARCVEADGSHTGSLICAVVAMVLLIIGVLTLNIRLCGGAAIVGAIAVFRVLFPS